MGDVVASIAEAAAAGVTRLITMGTDGPSSRAALDLAEAHPGVFAGAGHHPVNRHGPDLAELRAFVRHPKVVSIGEVGLDGASREDAAPLSDQERWLHELCQVAESSALPVSVHTRNSEERVLEVLSAHPGLTGVMHYFSLDWAWAERFLDVGFYISFSGLLTRSSRHELREVARRCPTDRLLLETDAPFGTPRGHGSQPNRPAWLRETAVVVAELRGIDLEALAELELANARRLFTRLD